MAVAFVTMRFKLLKILLALAILGNIVMWHRIWRLFSQPNNPLGAKENASPASGLKLHRRLSRLVTIVIRRFETFENDVAALVESVINSFPDISIIVVCDVLPYPPLELHFANESLRNVRLVNLQASFNSTFDERNPLTYVKTDYVLFLSDSTRLSTKQAVLVILFFLMLLWKIYIYLHFLNNILYWVSIYLARAWHKLHKCRREKSTQFLRFVNPSKNKEIWRDLQRSYEIFLDHVHEIYFDIFVCCEI